MARARNIKPGFFLNDELAEIEVIGRLLFAGLWTIADREGRLEDRPKKIKAAVLPYDDCDVDDLLQKLHNKSFVLRYEVEGCRYIQIINFSKHQNPHKNESPSSIPQPNKHSTSTVQVCEDSTTNPADSLNLIPDSGFPITDSLNLIPDNISSPDGSVDNNSDPDAPSKKSGKAGEYTPEFEEFYSTYPRRIEKRKAFKVWNARIKEKVPPNDMILAAQNYAASCIANRKEPDYIKHPSTFIGKDKPYEDWIRPPTDQQRRLDMPKGFAGLYELMQEDDNNDPTRSH